MKNIIDVILKFQLKGILLLHALFMKYIRSSGKFYPIFSKKKE